MVAAAASVVSGCTTIWRATGLADSRSPRGAAAGEPSPAAPSPIATTLPASMARPPPPTRELPVVSFPEVDRQRLDNGLSIVLGERRNAPLSTATLAVEAGRNRNPSEARLVGHTALAGGAGRFTATQLAQQLAAKGTTVEVEVGVDSVAWSITVAPEHLEFAIDALSSVARQPRWVYAEFTRVRDQQMARARELAQHDGTWPAYRLLHRVLFPSPHPYAEYDGTVDELGNVTLGDCQRWHRAHVRPDNASLVVTGDHDGQQVAELASRYLGTWKAPDVELGALPAPLPANGNRELEMHVIDRDKAERAQVLVGWRVPGAGTADHSISREAIRLLCGPQGLFSPTGTEGISHCTVTAYSGGLGLAVAGVSTNSGDVPATLKRLIDAAHQLATEPVSTAVWDGNVRDLLGSAPRRWESTRGLARELTHLEILAVPGDWPERELKLWESTDASRVREVAAHYLTPSLGVVAVTADADRIVKKLAALGPVRVHAPSDLRTTKTVPGTPDIHRSGDPPAVR